MDALGLCDTCLYQTLVLWFFVLAKRPHRDDALYMNSAAEQLWTSHSQLATRSHRDGNAELQKLGDY